MELVKKNQTCFYAGRVVGGHRDHRDFGWAIATCSAGGPRSSSKNELLKQRQANGIGRPEPRIGLQATATFRSMRFNRWYDDSLHDPFDSDDVASLYRATVGL